MQCHQCGTQIADNALICFRCGAPTTDRRVVAPRRPSPRRSVVPAVLALLALLLAALFMGRAASGQATSIIVWIIAALVGLAIVWRRFGRR